MTAAHRHLPFGTKVRVTHARSGRHVDVTINDRGPYIAGRIIDLSRAAAGVLGMTAEGIARVTVQILGR
jgi:rare lipoprotein A